MNDFINIKMTVVHGQGSENMITKSLEFIHFNLLETIFLIKTLIVIAILTFTSKGGFVGHGFATHVTRC